MILQRARRNRRWLGWIAGTIVLLALAAHTHFTTDLQKTLPDNDPDLNRILAFLKDRGSSRMMAIEAWPEGAASRDDVRAALAMVGPALGPFGASQIPQPAPEAAAKMLQVVQEHMSVLVSPEQLAEVAKRMEPEALRVYLQALKQRIASPEDQFSGTASRSDVLWVSGALMLSLQSSFSGTGFENGIVSHPDGVHLMLPLKIDFDPGEVGKCSRLMGAINGCCSQWRARGVHLEPIGSYRHFNDNMSSLYIDFFSTIPVGIALIALVLYSLARSWSGVLAMYLPALMGMIGAIAAVATFDSVVPLPLIGFVASLLGVAVDYGVQMTFAVRTGDHCHVHRPLLRSFIVSACAFSALAFSPVPALHSLGIMVVGGLGVAYVTARWLLPDVVAVRPGKDPWHRVTVPLLAWCERHPGRRLALAGLVTVLLAPGLMHLRFLEDLMRMDGSTKTTRDALDAFLHRWGALESSNFLAVSQPTQNAALAQVSEVRRRLAVPPSRVEMLLPDHAEQVRRASEWNRFWGEHDASFERDFSAACAEVKLRQAGFATSLERYRPVAEPTWIGLDDWAGTPLELALSTQVKPVDGGWQVASPLELPTPEASLAFEQRANTAGIEPVWVASRTHFATRLVQVLRSDLGHRGVVIALSIIAGIVLLVRSPRPSLAMLLPPTVALLWTFGALGLMGQELTPFTVLVAAFVGGIGIDCAVFLAQAEDRDRLMTPVIGCIATAVAGTGVMLFAHHPLLAGVGRTLTIGMTACLITSLLMTPALASGRARSAAP